MIWIELASLLGGYLVGSVLFGPIIADVAGLGDLRRIGSGNVGATNVLRTGRSDLALATLLLDGAKGWFAVYLIQWIGGDAAAAALGAVLGHMFSLWMGFRGGKGVATGLGVLLALAPPVAIAAIVAWVLLALLTSRSSAGALAAFTAAPIAALGLGNDRVAVATLLIALLVFVRHRDNWTRLIDGTEPRIGASKTAA